jgi:hypothetical protein
MTTAAQFITAYAARERMTPEQLLKAGHGVQPCDCGDKACEGWQIIRHSTGVKADRAIADGKWRTAEPGRVDFKVAEVADPAPDRGR